MFPLPSSSSCPTCLPFTALPILARLLFPSLSAEFKETQEAKLSARLAWLREADGELLVSHVLPPQPAETPPAKLDGVAAGIMHKLRNVADVKTKREAYLALLEDGGAVQRKGKEKKKGGEDVDGERRSTKKRKAATEASNSADGASAIDASSDDSDDDDSNPTRRPKTKKKKERKKIVLTGELAERYADLSSGSDEYERGSDDSEDGHDHDGGGFMDAAGDRGAAFGSQFDDDGSGMFVSSLSGMGGGASSRQSDQASITEQLRQQQKGPAQPKRRKNRLGQMARQRLAEKKYKEAAKHKVNPLLDQVRNQDIRKMQASKATVLVVRLSFLVVHVESMCTSDLLDWTHMCGTACLLHCGLWKELLNERRSLWASQQYPIHPLETHLCLFRICADMSSRACI